MHIVGLTGGIGSGKSLVAKIFSHLNVPVFNADDESKRILDEDPSVHSELVRWFGGDILQNGRPDRSLLAGIVFADPQQLSRLNSLMHPRVMERFTAWCGQYRNKSYVLHEAAILFESGFYRHMHTSILVTAPEQLRIERIKQRDNSPLESIRQRMKNQWSDEQKIPLAGYIVNNDGKTLLLPAILEIHNKLIV